MGPDSFQWCPVTGQGATGTNWSRGSFSWTWGRTSSLWGYWSPVTGCPGRLWSLFLWRYSRPTWTRSSAACSRLCQGVWNRRQTEVPSNPDHSVILWISLWLIWVHCPVCARSQLLAHPQPASWGSEWEQEKASMLCKYCWVIAKTLVFFQSTLLHSQTPWILIQMELCLDGISKTSNVTSWLEYCTLLVSHSEPLLNPS